MGKYRLLKSIERAEKAAAWHASIAAAQGIVTAPVVEEVAEEVVEVAEPEKEESKKSSKNKK